MSYKTVDAEFVQEHLGKLPLIDVRPADMYAAGHIPGAKSVPLGPIEEQGGDVAAALAKCVKAAGVEPDDEVIVYCQGGITAKRACDDLEKAGYTHLDYYQGSFGDWSSDPSRPVEK